MLDNTNTKSLTVCVRGNYGLIRTDADESEKERTANCEKQLLLFFKW